MPSPLLYIVAPIPDVARSQQLDVLWKKLGEKAYWQAFVNMFLGVTPLLQMIRRSSLEEEAAIEGKRYALVHVRLSLPVSSAEPDNKDSFLIIFGGTGEGNCSDAG